MHEDAYSDAPKHAQAPDCVALKHTTSIKSSVHIQSLVESGFNEPVSLLNHLPLTGAQPFLLWLHNTYEYRTAHPILVAG